MLEAHDLHASYVARASASHCCQTGVQYKVDTVYTRPMTECQKLSVSEPPGQRILPPEMGVIILSYRLQDQPVLQLT